MPNIGTSRSNFWERYKILAFDLWITTKSCKDLLNFLHDSDVCIGTFSFGLERKKQGTHLNIPRDLIYCLRLYSAFIAFAPCNVLPLNKEKRLKLNAD